MLSFIVARSAANPSISIVTHRCLRVFRSRLTYLSLVIELPLPKRRRTDNAFFKAQDVVVNALDNVAARMYVDGRCVVSRLDRER